MTKIEQRKIVKRHGTNNIKYRHLAIYLIPIKNIYITFIFITNEILNM